jgi:hypothetical protein
MKAAFVLPYSSNQGWYRKYGGTIVGRVRGESFGKEVSRGNPLSSEVPLCRYLSGPASNASAPHHSDLLNQQFAPGKGCSGILMAVHPVGSLGLLKLRELQFPRNFGVNNLLKHHI